MAPTDSVGPHVSQSEPHGGRANLHVVIVEDSPVFSNYAFPQYREISLKLGADYFFDKSRDFPKVREVLVGLAGDEAAESD